MHRGMLTSWLINGPNGRPPRSSDYPSPPTVAQLAADHQVGQLRLRVGADYHSDSYAMLGVTIAIRPDWSETSGLDHVFEVIGFQPIRSRATAARPRCARIG